MLTKSQIEVARENLRAWEDSGLLPDEITALDALAAYSRVAALLESKCSIYTADELRRALEG